MGTPCVLYVLTVIISSFTTLSVAEVSPTIIMGLDTGEMYRCKFNNASDCTPLNEQDSPVFSLAISGEFMYIGLQTGDLRRCRITKPSNCTSFHELYTEINDLFIWGRYIYAATSEGISKCGLRKSEDCSLFYNSEAPVYSLTVLDGYLYAGMDESTISCSLKSDPTNCTVSFKTASAVNALAVSGHYLLAGLQDGSVQNCTINDDDNMICLNAFETKSPIKAIDIFDEHVQTSLETGDVLRFNLENNETSTISRNGSVILSIFTIYATTGVKKHYVGESADCVWQFMSCPPYVVYYDIESRAPLELHVKDGKLYSTKDELFDTVGSSFGHSGRSAIFVMDPAGKIYASTQHPILLLHHSSLMAGNPVSAAGELKVGDGVIEYVSSCSGHYRPSLALTQQITSALKRQGYQRNVTIRDCGRMELMIDLDYQKTNLYYKARYEEYLKKMEQLIGN